MISHPVMRPATFLVSAVLLTSAAHAQNAAPAPLDEDEKGNKN
jgi:hypothetical protein